MTTIEDRMKDCEMCKQAAENLKRSKEMMELIKQYYTHGLIKRAPPPHYVPTDSLFPYLW